MRASLKRSCVVLSGMAWLYNMVPWENADQGAALAGSNVAFPQPLRSAHARRADPMVDFRRFMKGLGLSTGAEVNRVTPSGPALPEPTRRRLQQDWNRGMWSLSLRNECVRPPDRLSDGAENPLKWLGECDDVKCGLCRLYPGSEKVRDDVLEFSLEQVRKEPWLKDGLTYCAVGCGSLYFDWSFLEILRQEGVPIRQVWLVERCYRPGACRKAEADGVRQARDAFVSWFADVPGLEIHAFSSYGMLLEWVLQYPEVGKANLLTQQDAPGADAAKEDPDFCTTVMADGALLLESYTAMDGVIPCMRSGRFQGGAVRPLEQLARREGRWEVF